VVVGRGADVDGALEDGERPLRLAGVVQVPAEVVEERIRAASSRSPARPAARASWVRSTAAASR
jgi:hypothetical protein